MTHETQERPGSYPGRSAEDIDSEANCNRLDIATAPRRDSKRWKRDTIEWAELAARLDTPAGIKECGNYVLGRLRNSKRSRGTLVSRSALTLDVDHACPGLPEAVGLVFGYRALIHTTYSSTPDAPRFRLIVALSRDVTPDEYRHIARVVMGMLGPEQFDPGSAQPERYMFWPATQDPETYQRWHLDGDPLDVEAVLALPDPGSVPEDTAAAEVDLAEPPTAQELERASQRLEQGEEAMKKSRNPENEDAGGRNRAVYDWLFLLYCFVKGACLDRDDVDTRIWGAAQQAPGDHPYRRAEFDHTAGNAWGNARPTRPHVDDPTEDFEVLPVEMLPELRPRPDLFHPYTKGLLADVATRAVRQHMTCAVGSLDGRLYVYREGVYRPNRRELGIVTSALLHNDYRPSHLKTIEDKLLYDSAILEIDGGPQPQWINVRNGLLDWATGELHPHSPDVPSLVQLPVEWNPEADCPAFRKFLGEVLPPDCLEPREGGPGFVWELLGYLAYAGNPMHLAILLRGKGRNGKGAFLRVVARMLGGANVSATTLTDLVENRFSAANLYGKIANIAGDIDPRWLKDTAKLKAMTGEDDVSAERKYGQPFDFRPWAVPVYSANRSFRVSDSSEGFFSRWVVIPFPNSFVGKEDRGLDARIGTRDELEGVLRHAVGALPALMRRGRLPEPPSIVEAKRQFVLSGDQVRAWLDTYCELDPGAFSPRAALYSHYRAREDDGHKTLGKSEFYERLEQIGGIAKAGLNGYDGFRGIRLKEIEELD